MAARGEPRLFGHRTESKGHPFRHALDSVWDNQQRKYVLRLECGHTILKGRSAGPFARGAFCDRCGDVGQIVRQLVPRDERTLWQRVLDAGARPC